MSAFVEFPMHPSPGRMVGLAELLALVPDNEWAWSVLDFDGIGAVPDGLGFEEFGLVVLTSPVGFPMSWEHVRAFAVGLDQCWDLLLVAVEDRAHLSPERLAASDFGGCLVVFEAIDSGAWEVTAADSVEKASGLVATRNTGRSRGPKADGIRRPMEAYTGWGGAHRAPAPAGVQSRRVSSRRRRTPAGGR
ncbi:hypothetical protein [Streptomyces laurentii]|uniref:hypothetical protein n=1 Tax=Streptomyces laurentii TaxID=39478 RepID=UPI0036C8A0FB